MKRYLDKVKRTITLFIFAALVLCSVDTSDSDAFALSHTPAEDSLFVQQETAYEVASLETTADSILREISNSAGTARSSLQKNRLTFLSLLLSVSFTCIIIFILLLGIKDIKNTHRFIITYIHDLDGSKSMD